jgi:hypothetical protein
MRAGRLRGKVAAAAALLVTAGLASTAMPAAAASSAAGSRHAAVLGNGRLLGERGGTNTPANRLADPGRVLPRGWSRSKDEVLAVQGDQSGLHVLVATESSGYAWRTVANLGDPGVETSQWIGHGCLTGSGRFAVVVYAPREVTNMAGLMGILGRAAIVNVATGHVDQLGGGYSVAYFNPGCGTGDTVVLTHGGWGGDSPQAPASTGLQVVNAATGKTVTVVTVPGQLTSAVPYRGAVAAAGGPGLVQISTRGKVTLLARSAAVPFRLIPDAAGGLAYETLTGKVVQVHRFAGGRSALIGKAALGTVMLTGSGGRVWVTGSGASRVGRLPAGWRAVDVPAGSLVSTTGTLAVTGIGSAARSGTSKRDPAEALPVVLKAQVLAGRRPAASFSVQTGAARVLAAPGGTPGTSGTAEDAAASRLGRHQKSGMVTASTAGSPSTPVSADRTCAIAIDDPSIQAYQPEFNQVEWAADEAVQNDLTDTRPAGLYGSSLSSYTPQGLFPSPSLDGGGTMPAQVLLGVLTQESNLEQASAHDIQGQASNPLTSFDWYGNWTQNSQGVWSFTDTINWADSDCGYGIGQVTTGMCLTKDQAGDYECEYATPMSAEDQLAVAVDYQANIAAAMQILSGYWNELYSDGITFDKQSSTTAPDAEADYINSWYMALWAYNSGLEPGSSKYGNSNGCTPSPSCTDGNGDWGLGYADNPIDPAYPPDRPIFPDGSSAVAPNGGTYSPTWDMSNPEYWTYQEKVLSWAYDSITLYNYDTGSDQQAFAYAAGNPIYPPLATFCTSADSCNDSGLNTTGDNSSQYDSCTLTGSYVDHCWWHEPVSWTYCNTTEDSCGESVLTYAGSVAAPADPTIPAEFAQQCTETPLPSTAVIVSDGGQAALGCPGQNWSAAGSMTWNFAADTGTSPTTYPSKILFDQIGAGFGGHFWFGYTIPNNNNGDSSGTWTNVTSTTPESSPTNYTDQKITGTWAAPSSVTSWSYAQVYVAIPGIGAWDPQANYQISPGGGQAVQHRVVNQAQQQNSWVSLGIFKFDSGGSVSLSNVTYSGLGDDIAWSAVAFVPSAAPSTDYVAMGDSYSSGEGLGPYTANSDYTYNGMLNDCHRSQTQAFPDLVKMPGQTTSIASQAGTAGSGDQFSFIACSNSTTPNITENAVDNNNDSPGSPAGEATWYTWDLDQVTPWDPGTLGNGGPSIQNVVTQTTTYGTSLEDPQADQGWLSPSTTLVTISQGGDDAGFASVMVACDETDTDVSPDGNGCSASNYYVKNVNGSTDPYPLYEWEPYLFLGTPAPSGSGLGTESPSAIEWHLEQAYAAIAAAAPNAHIVVIGYPNLFPGNTDPTSPCSPDAVITITIPDEAMLNGFGDDLETAISTAVAYEKGKGADISYINPNAAFSGHQVCGSTPWINGVVNEEESNAGTSIPGNDSYHLEAAGEQEYATLVDECLAGTLSETGQSPNSTC